MERKGQTVVISEPGLKRFAARNADRSVEFKGGRVLVLLDEDFPGDDEDDTYTAWAILEGKRAFGGFVRFEAERAITFEGLRRKEEEAFLRGVVEEFLEVFAELCRCGQFGNRCDCCPSCKGTGHVFVEAVNRSERCGKCFGKGYTGDDVLTGS